MSGAAARPGYSRHVLEAVDAAAVWRALADLPGVVAVNLVGEGGSHLVSDDTIAQALAGGARTVTVEAIDEPAYRQLLAARAGASHEAARQLAARWRSRTVATTSSEVQALLQQLGDLAVLTLLFARQRNHDPLARLAGRVLTTASQLSASASVHDDTVRAMDDVRHVLMPLLAEIAARSA